MQAAAIGTLSETLTMNGLDPEADLADVIARIPGHPISRIDELPPCHWQPRWPA